ncbi:MULTISPECIES: iron-containing alcohol dehydrogenase [unclassified Polaromonas]|jgi:NADP-dependent alcohol dehydrogenase|uniref:iron-containing alcohol dehydrogenase n=1 Tax=unclassified Polaromonas TaxID=2638319 RepID=UPI0018CB6545|nr:MULTISPECIES: iron-containing alcohol dehydrogenase [unclassified Polaromonas]MBG6073324.1 NADP-dependent alcohol dehydrogenase [Polaromonas sp. CG_9.7]MBG6115336.1 NADP-dependent alcohol dehydrogenase [Polaromonas sp. CG_9.2]MDH6182959.1 NADP-dependent alcohol dehydrogenase [Polaromonas sp. CG_23.6]
MQSFTFHNPTQIIFGRDKVAELANLVPATAKVLLLYGGASAEKTGTLAEVRAALGERVLQEFGGIEPNPTYETLMKAVEQVKREKIDFLLAVGGGSVIDGTKFVAAAACFDGEPWDILLKQGNNVTRALPFGTVLTLPATGSEMNNGSVVTRKATQTKLAFKSLHVFPVFSVLDPTKTFTLPPKQIANGIADAFVHTVEQYLTYPVQGLAQDRFAEGLLQTLIEIAPKALAEPEDYDTRANLMWTATLALNGLIGAGVPQDWATHMIGHELTALYGIDHARTLAIVLPPLLNVQRKTKRAKLLQYAERVWHITSGTDDERIDAAIERTRGFFESLGISTRLSGYHLGSEVVDAVVRQLEANGMTRLGEHQDISPQVSRTILEAAL